MKQEIEYPAYIYSLEWDAENFRFTLFLGKEGVSILDQILNGAFNIRPEIIEKFNQSGIFEAIERNDIKVFKFKEETDEDLVYHWNVLPLREYGNNPCSRCSEVDSIFFGEKDCYACQNTRKELQSVNQENFDQGFKVLDVFHWVAKIFSFLEVSFDTKKIQNYHFTLNIKSGSRSSMGAWLDYRMLERILALPEKRFIESVENMKLFDAMLFKYKNSSFRAEIVDEKRFFLSVPGSAVTLSVEKGNSWNYPWSYGVDLTEHNIDSRFQQLLFVIGLVSLCQD